MSRRNTILGLGVILLLALISWAWSDYRRWLALGPGGVPYNVRGWAQVTWMRLGARDPFDMSLFQGRIGTGDDLAVLGTLPIRAGDRPRIDPHPIPHRQLDQHAGDEPRRALTALFDRTIENAPALLEYQKSHFETRNDAIWLRDPEKGNPNTRAQGEIAHIHPSDGSMHMTLSPSDAKVVLESRWGELHTLAGTARLPATYMMVYSPRDAGERDVSARILQAAIEYAVGRPGLSRGEPRMGISP